MKSLKFLLILSALFAFAGVARADFLYWQVGAQSDSLKTMLLSGGGVSDANITSVDYARLVVLVNGKATSYSYASLNSDLSMTDAVAFDISGLTTSTLSFAIELGAETKDGNGNGTGNFYVMGGTTSTITYDDAYQAGYIGTGGISNPPSTAYGLNASYDIPEPGSALLLLLGGSMLALRRKRK